MIGTMVRGRSKGSPRRTGPVGKAPRAGLTLLEVLLSLLVLVVALAGISSLIFIGRYSAADAQGMTQAQLLCETKMDSIVTGIDPAESSQGLFPENSDYMFEVTTQQPGTPGLLSVRVRVSQNPSNFENPLEYSLVRWIPDPDFEAGVAQ